MGNYLNDMFHSELIHFKLPILYSLLNGLHYDSIEALQDKAILFSIQTK